MHTLTKENIIEFQEKGYTVLVEALDKDELHILHEEADILSNHLMTEGYDLMADLGCIVEPWTCGYLDLDDDESFKVDKAEYKKQRDSIYWDNPTKILVSDVILCKYSAWAFDLLQAKQDIYLLNEQFIIKPPLTSKQSQFAWHKDSDYYTDMRHRQEPTIACWTALDPVNENNGTIELVDFLGQPMILQAPAGTVLFMSNQLLHKSTGNSSRTFRRAYMPQYSKKPLVNSDSALLAPKASQCVGLAVKC